MEYVNKLNPTRFWRTPHRIKGMRQQIFVTHNTRKIDQNQLLEVRFPNLGSYDVIVPGTASLSFNIKLFSKADPNRTLESNIGRAIVKNVCS